MRFDLDALASPASLQELPIDAIDEDPLQPRQEFEPSALQELAETIAERGVLQPVSVRNHPKQPARYILNFGARRLRASRLAKKTSIPAFVDDLATSYDQVIENEQREGLTPLELALFVERRIGEGDSQGEIARRLGKSRPYVTYATALIGAPDWLMTLYRGGRCRGLRELHELRQLHGRRPEVVKVLQSDDKPVTRDRIAAIKAMLVAEEHAEVATPSVRDAARVPELPAVTFRAEGAEVPGLVAGADCLVKNDPQRLAAKGARVLLADYDGAVAQVLLDSAPAKDGDVFIRIDGDRTRRAVAATSLGLLRIVSRHRSPVE